MLGAWGMRLYFDQTLGHWNTSQRYLLQLSEDLKLNPEQQSKVAVILRDQKSRMEALRRQWRFQVFTLDRQGEDAISGVLSDCQTDAYMSIHDRIHGKWTVSFGVWIRSNRHRLGALGALIPQHF